MSKDILQELWVAWMKGELPPVSGMTIKEYEDKYFPLSLHSADYYRRQNAALKAEGKKKKGKKKNEGKPYNYTNRRIRQG